MDELKTQLIWLIVRASVSNGIVCDTDYVRLNIRLNERQKEKIMNHLHHNTLANPTTTKHYDVELTFQLISWIL